MLILGVSVVLAVYKELEHVTKTVDSVLSQKGINLEFIIVSDGAPPDVIKALRHYAHDPRVKLVEQSNTGLTRALINGCSVAKYPYIARIDAGDVMLPKRLQKQAQLLNDKPNLGIVPTWVSVETEEGYPLYQVEYSQEALSKGLRAVTIDQYLSPFHASVMFRKSIYEQVGGYRREFYYTQDCDLWSRMIEVSEIEVVTEALTTGLFSERGISGDNASTQKQLVEFVVQCNYLRQKNCSDLMVLPEVKNLIEKVRMARRNFGRRSRFRATYFISRVLMGNQSPHALKYWARALKEKPWSLRAWVFWVVCYFRE